ncbi:aldehyde dehydrogenase family protein [Arthrobacter sp. NPDC058097]|uniref:aldehyde dehydrogenase family protein n=1 Tax=Arthrobacter sp. NPDC058097 TaxID=3346340 RepID=UPI0036DBC3BC
MSRVEVAGVAVPHPDDVFIAGAWVPGEGGRRTIISPSSEEVVTDVALPSVAQAAQAVKIAHEQGLPNWAGLPVADRVAAVRRMCDLFEERFGEMGLLWAAEAGMSLRHSKTLHKYAAATAWGSAIAAAEEALKDEVRSGAPGDVIIRHEPAGVVVGIISYNGPVVTMGTKIIPALLAGCPVIVKGASDSQLIMRVVADCAEQADLPVGTLSVLCGDSTVGRALTSDARVDLVSITGGHHAAQDVIEATRGRFARTHLELGGKSAALVLPDADFDQVLKVLMMGSAAGTGQVCALLSRILVPRSRFDEFVEAITMAWQRLRVGDPFDPETIIGPLTNKAGLERTEAFLAKALEEGGRVVAGGGRPEGLEKGWFFEPTVVVDVARESTLARNEVFGPISAVMAYESVEDGIALANDSDFGLSGAVFTRDRDLGIECAKRIRSGSVGVNVFGPDVTAPWGGVKQSGWGREGGPEGILEFTELKQIAISPAL